MTDTPSNSTTRPSLLMRLRDGQDAESWTTFVSTYAPLVYRFGRRQGLQDADAADITQEVMEQVARSIRNFEYQPDKGRFRDWLGTLTRHKIGRFFRKKSKDSALTGSAEEDSLDCLPAPVPDGEWTEAFHAQVLQVALQRIEGRFEVATWQAFENVWVQRCSAQEAASKLQLPVEAIYLAKSRVLKQLREEVLALAEDFPQYVPLN